MNRMLSKAWQWLRLLRPNGMEVDAVSFSKGKKIPVYDKPKWWKMNSSSIFLRETIHKDLAHEDLDIGIKYLFKDPVAVIGNPRAIMRASLLEKHGEIIRVAVMKRQCIMTATVDEVPRHVRVIRGGFTNRVAENVMQSTRTCFQDQQLNSNESLNSELGVFEYVSATITKMMYGPDHENIDALIAEEKVMDRNFLNVMAISGMHKYVPSSGNKETVRALALINFEQASIWNKMSKKRQQLESGTNDRNSQRLRKSQKRHRRNEDYMTMQEDEEEEEEQTQQQQQQGSESGYLQSMILENSRMTSTDKLTDEQVLGNAYYIRINAVHTVASFILSAIYFLGRHPEYQEKARREFEALESSNLPITTLADFVRDEVAPETTMFLKEVLRVHPPIPMSGFRQVVDSEGCTINDYTLPRGMMMTYSYVMAHHHPDFWQDPMEFKPERFHPDNAKSIRDFSYIPFGTDPTQCMGQHIAMGITKSFLGQFLLKHKLDTYEMPEHEFNQNQFGVTWPVDDIFAHIGLPKTKNKAFWNTVAKLQKQN